MFRTCLFATNKDLKVKNIVFGLKNEDLMKEWFINLKQAIVILFIFFHFWQLIIEKNEKFSF